MMTKKTWSAPSREAILACLRTAGVPLTVDELAAHLHVVPAHLGDLQQRLRAMERDGQLLPNRKGVLLLASKLDFVAGRVQGHRDGFGFLIPDEGGQDVFLSPREMQKVMHGDRVLLRRTGVDARGRPEGRIVEVTERAGGTVVGRFANERGVDLVVPEDQRIRHDIVIAAGRTAGARPGQVVCVEIIEPPAGGSPPIGHVVEVLGAIDDPGMEIEIAVRKFDVPHVFGEAALALAAKLPKTVRAVDRKGRVDLRDVPLVTIDGEDARDFDDAVYCEPMVGEPMVDEPMADATTTNGEAHPRTRADRASGSAFRLLVAIADVAHYVREGEALDDAALERSTSVYFPRRVIPMLPERLSNDLCSLNPDVDRLALVCDMVIAADGTIRAYQFYEAVIRSAARLTYDEVWAMLSGVDHADVPAAHAELAPHLEHLYRLYQTLAGARQARGAIDFETVETKIVCDADGRIERIVPTQRNDAHKLIEECMLAANVCAADWMRRSGHPGLFRVHDAPTADKLAKLREFLRSFGLSLGGGEAPGSADFAALIERIRSRPDAMLLQTMMLRSMQQAQYSPDNVGHFGLAYEGYAHFTSPIRRYPDLLVHRVIKALLHGGHYRPDPDPHRLREVMRARPPGLDEDLSEPQIDDEGAAMGLVFDERRRDSRPASGARRLSARNLATGGAAAHSSAAAADRREHQTWRWLGTLCSMHERRADEAARDVTAWLKCVWIRERIGETFAGHVTGVAPFGVFVTLDELHVEGLVHVSELGSEYFRYHETAHELRGERSGRRLRLTDRIEVQVARVDLDARRIDFRPLEGGGSRVAEPGPADPRKDASATVQATAASGRSAGGPGAGEENGGPAKRVKRTGRSSGSAGADRSSAGRTGKSAGRNAAGKGRTGLRRRH